MPCLEPPAYQGRHGTQNFLFILSGKKKKKSLKPTDPARGADGKFPPSPAAPGFGSALAGGFEDAETQQSGIRHRSAATQALTWDRSEAQRAAGDNHLQLHSSGPEKVFPQRLGPRGFLSVPPWLSHPQSGAPGSRAGLSHGPDDDQRAPGIQHQAAPVPRWGWDQGGSPSPIRSSPVPPFVHRLLGSRDADWMQRGR